MLSVFELLRQPGASQQPFRAQPLAYSLSQHSSLQDFQLHCTFEEPATSVLLPALTMKHWGLRHLSLGVQMVYCERGLQSAVSGLSCLTNLTELRMPSLSCDDRHQLQCALAHHHTRSIDDEREGRMFPWAGLATALPLLCDLRYLKLANAPWGWSAKVVQALSALTLLMRLDLEDSGINASTAPQLACSLRFLVSLQYIWLDSNKLGGCGRELASALTCATHWPVRVTLCDTGLEEGEAEEVIQALDVQYDRVPADSWVGLEHRILDLSGSVSEAGTTLVCVAPRVS